MDNLGFGSFLAILNTRNHKSQILNQKSPDLGGEINKLLRAVNKATAIPAVILEIVFLGIKTFILKLNFY